MKTGLVKAITIEDHETRYDIMTDQHGHFKCESCGVIYNFSIDIDDFASDDLAGFQVKDKGVYFKGVCSGCLQNNKQNEEDHSYD